MGVATTDPDLASVAKTYRAAVRAAIATPDFTHQFELTQIAGVYATQLAARSAETLEPVLEVLYRDTALWRPAVADHVVWSTYTAQKPRRLHIWPRGDRCGEYGPIGNGRDVATLCGERVFLDPSDRRRAWRRARPGEWHDTLRHDPNRVCDTCRQRGGDSDLVAEHPGRHSAWAREQIQVTVHDRLMDDLVRTPTNRGLVHSRARRLSDQYLAAVEIAWAAEDLRDLGAGAVRRILGPQAYDWPDGGRHRLDSAGDLMTSSRWEALLRWYLNALSGQTVKVSVAELLRIQVRELLT